MKALFLLAVGITVALLVSLLALIFIFSYSWLWSLVSPLSLWQIVILTTIVAIPMVLRFGEGISSGVLDSPVFLLFGPLIGVGGGLLFGVAVTSITGIDHWYTTLLSVIVISTVLYAILKASDAGLHGLRALDEGYIEAGDVSETHPLREEGINRVMRVSSKKPRSRKRKPR